MIVSVIYPRREGARFDMEYYATKHIPLVKARWGGHGMRSFQALTGTRGLGGEAEYVLIALLDFPSEEAFLAAAGAHGDEIMGDVPHFTDIQPFVQLNQALT